MRAEAPVRPWLVCIGTLVAGSPQLGGTRRQQQRDSDNSCIRGGLTPVRGGTQTTLFGGVMENIAIYNTKLYYSANRSWFGAATH